MDAQTKILLYGAVIAGGAILLTKGKIGGYAGSATGHAVGSAAGGAVRGVVGGIYDEVVTKPAAWAEKQQYIPIIDEAAKAAVWFKKLGYDNRWFW